MEVSARQPEMPARTVRMPALAQSTHTHTHTLHSALICLEALGVGPHRIVLRRIGRDAKAAGTIVRQFPDPGTPLTGASIIQLDIAGLGFTHALPVGMWDSGGEASAGTREILEPFDDPLEKLKHWFHEGAPFVPHLSGESRRLRTLAVFVRRGSEGLATGTLVPLGLSGRGSGAALLLSARLRVRS